MVFRGRWGAVDVERLSLAAKLHDLGKVRVPDSVLNKPGALDPLERELMNAHAEEGFRMLEAHPELSYEALAVRHHHERFDGRGYPAGLRGEEIPFQARVVAIVDAFDAMTEDRVYKKGRSESEAIAELERCAGSHFCPELTSDFVNFIHARNA
jgi:HD-GYP domain-containing protein (c-di-GMP phosphodiesterase class II)